MAFIIPADHEVSSKESRQLDKYLGLARKQKTLEHENDSDSNLEKLNKENLKSVEGLRQSRS